MIKPATIDLKEFLILPGIDLADSKCPKCSKKASELMDNCKWGYRSSDGCLMADAMFEHCEAGFGVSMTANKKAYEKWLGLIEPFGITAKQAGAK
jgi:hypothetical protein